MKTDPQEHNPKARPVLLPLPITERLSAEFWEKVNYDGPVSNSELGKCWEWTGSLRDGGYGQFIPRWRYKPMRAHRYSWMIESGPIKDGLWVLHKCDNPKCVNPSHLFLGTAKDNTRDCIEKGRFRPRSKHCKKGHQLPLIPSRNANGTLLGCLICRTERGKTRSRGTGVGRGSNNSKKTHCKRGHEFTPENTHITTSGGRQCKTCNRNRKAK